MPRIALLSTSDTDLLSARASGAEYVWANPARPGHQDMGAALEGADIVVARILGGPQDLCSGFRRISATGTPSSQSRKSAAHAPGGPMMLAT